MSQQAYEKFEHNQRARFKDQMLMRITKAPKSLNAFDWEQIHEICLEDAEFAQQVEAAKNPRKVQSQRSPPRILEQLTSREANFGDDLG